MMYNIELCPYSLVHTKPCSHSRQTEFLVWLCALRNYAVLARRLQTSWVANFDLPHYKIMLLFPQGGINVDYDSRTLYFLNFTYIWKLETVDLCSHVSVVYTYQYILLLQLMVSTVRPAVVSPFLGHNRTQYAAMPRTLGHGRTKLCLYIWPNS